MPKPCKEDWIKSAVCLALALLSFFMVLPESFKLDQSAQDYFDSSIKQAGVAYASVRVINASVSVIKESQLQVQPAGVGLSLAVGQVLDPLDDMTERLSDVLVWSITALGLQKLVYEICLMFASELLGAGLLALALLFLLPFNALLPFKRVALQFVLLVALVRCFLPVSALLNNTLEASFFQPKIEQAHQAIQMNTEAMSELAEFSLPESNSKWGFVSSSSDFIEQKARQLKAIFQHLMVNAAELISNLLVLTYLYATLFLIQVIVLPLLLFYLLYKLLKTFLDVDLLYRSIKG
jgi:hypothetical protein